MSALLDHLWQSTLFALAIWLLTLALASNRAAVRHALWLAASLKFLLPFSLFFALGEWIGETPAYEPSAGPSAVAQAFQIAAPLVAPIAGHTGDAGTGFPWLALFAAAWAAGALVVALRWLAAWRAACHTVDGAAPVALEHGLDVRASADVGEPAVARVLHPVILVPAGLVDALSRGELRAVLAHEREHIERRDNLSTGAHMLVETLFWFHPLVWWIGRRVIDERERACDEAVVDAGHASRDYAAGIIAVCRHCRVDRRTQGAISALSGNLPQRIRRIICDSQPLALGVGKAMALSALVVALVAVPVTAGAVKDERAHYEIVRHDAQVLGTARVTVTPAAAGGARGRIVAGDRELRVENISMAELVALAYDVDPRRIYGAEHLGALRYDVRATVAAPFADPARFDAAALNGLVNQVIGAHFQFELYVNSRCQAPCGPRALTLKPR